jgi:hypothetical protein
MNSTTQPSLSWQSPKTAIPAALFLFSGRGPLRNAQIEALRYRTQLLVMGRMASDLGEVQLRG